MAKGKHNVAKVRSSSAEMDYEVPAEVDFSSGLVFRGVKAWRTYRQWRRQMALLTPNVRKAFPDDQSVNRALREVMESRRASGRRRSA